MSVLNVSLFDSHVPRELGVGYHNVGTGVLRASDKTTIDYVEAHYGQRCGHLPLDAQRVCVLVHALTDEIHSHLKYLSQLFGKEIKAITPDQLQQEQKRFSECQALIVPYINVPETEKRIQTELGAESWGITGDMVSFLKNKADFYQFIDEFELYGFRTPDYRVVHIADLHKEALGFLNTIEDIVKKASVPQYPLGVMLRAAESDGNYGCCLVYEQKNLVRVIPNGEVDHAAYYASWDEALTASQKHLAASMNQQKETRVVISRYLDMADSPGMSVVIMNGQVESLGWNGQLQKDGSKACIGTSTYRPANASLARLQQQYEGQTLAYFDGFYPKPRVALRKGPQPLRCNPIVVEQIRPQGDDGGSIRPAPAHAPFFHATIDDQGHRALDHAAPHGIALLAPLRIRTYPGSLVLHIPDGFLDGVTRLGTQPCAQVTQSLERLIHPAVPQPEAVQVQLVIALVR